MHIAAGMPPCPVSPSGVLCVASEIPGILWYCTENGIGGCVGVHFYLERGIHSFRYIFKEVCHPEKCQEHLSNGSIPQVIQKVIIPAETVA